MCFNNILTLNNKIHFSILKIFNFSLFSIEENYKYFLVIIFGIKISIRKKSISNNIDIENNTQLETNVKLLNDTDKYNNNLLDIKNYMSSIKMEILEIKNLNKKKNNKVIYTCITNRYDNLVIYSYINDDWDYICFTDDETLIENKVYGNWIIKPLQFNELDGTRNNRWHKFHPHILFPDYEESVYIDSNINIKSSYLFECIDNVRKDDITMSIPPHYMRDCLYEEANVLIAHQTDNIDIIEKQISIYKKDGFPSNYGLSENNCIYRKHNDKKIIQIMEDWWYWVKNHSKRDQISLFYVLWKHNYKMPYLTYFTIRLDNDNFEFFHHNIKRFDKNTSKEILIEECKKIGLI